jgi:uncharacterized membrane-anchored protein YjiN (DUF445 family)
MARTRVGRVSYPRANGDVPAEKPGPAEGGPMPKEQIRERIQELLGELEQIEAVDQEARDRLASVLHDIREAVGESGEEASDEHESLLERLNEATQHFKESHPTLTAMVGRVADSLSNLGI